MILLSMYSKTLSDEGLIISPAKYAPIGLVSFFLQLTKKIKIKIQNKILFKSINNFKF